MENHKVRCLNKQCPESKIQTTMEADSGYSNWTVMENGYIEFKCHGCGKFGSTNEYKNEGSNQLDNFEVKCLNCGETEWTYEIQDVDSAQEPTHIQCTHCKIKSYQQQ